MKYKKNNEGTSIINEDYHKKIIFDNNDFRQKGYSLQIVTIPPKTRQRLHFHKIQTEVFYILSGECIININNTNYLAKQGDAFICEPNDIHNLWNKTDEPFKLVVFKINLPEKNQDSFWQE